MNSPFRIEEMSVTTVVKQVQRQISLSLKEALGERSGLVRVRGRLGQIRQSPYETYFGVKLTDGQDEMLIDLPGSLVKHYRLRGGERVYVTGLLKAQCARFNQYQLSVRLEVTDLELAGGAVAVEETQQMLSLARLKSLGGRRHAFPAGEIKLSVIHSRSGKAQVDEDFLQELGAAGGSVKREMLPVNILSADEIAGAIRAATGNVLVLIRGGGDDDQFEVFDNLKVVEAMAQAPGYRVIGLGHTANTTLLDLVVDFAGNTPTQAGGHLRHMIERYRESPEALAARLAESEQALRQARTVIEAAKAQAQQPPSTDKGEGTSGGNSIAIGLAFAAGALCMAALLILR